MWLPCIKQYQQSTDLKKCPIACNYYPTMQLLLDPTHTGSRMQYTNWDKQHLPNHESMKWSTGLKLYYQLEPCICCKKYNHGLRPHNSQISLLQQDDSSCSVPDARPETSDLILSRLYVQQLWKTKERRERARIEFKREHRRMRSNKSECGV